MPGPQDHPAARLQQRSAIVDSDGRPKGGVIHAQHMMDLDMGTSHVINLSHQRVGAPGTYYLRSMTWPNSISHFPSSWLITPLPVLSEDK